MKNLRHKLGADATNSSVYPQNPYDRNDERGRADYDLRHAFSANFTWEIPGRENNVFLSGWQWNGIFNFRTGLPFSPSIGGGGKYNFPHTVAQESVREALEAMALRGGERSRDYDLGIHYTSATDSNEQPLGSLAVVISPTGKKRNVWRFGDRPRESVDLGRARLYRAPPREREPRLRDAISV